MNNKSSFQFGRMHTAHGFDYNFSVVSTSGWVAVKPTYRPGLVIINPARRETDGMNVRNEEGLNPGLTFWSCTSGDDYTPFGDITYLSCGGAQLDELDVSRLTELESLYADRNNLKIVGLSSNTKLKTAHLRFNLIEALNLPSKENLSIEFGCQRNTRNGIYITVGSYTPEINPFPCELRSF